MSNTAQSETVRVSIELSVDPLRAFQFFTQDIDKWWSRDRRNHFRAPWVGIMRFEAGVNGRLIEIYDEDTNDIYEVGRITIWEPGTRLTFDWRLPNFSADEITQVDIRFERTEIGTLVTLEHSGWDTLRPDHPARHHLSGNAFRMMRSGWWADHLVAIKKHSEGETT